MSVPAGPVVFENDYVVAFRSPTPEAPTHVVVQAKGPRTLLELAAGGTDRAIVETLRALSLVQRRMSLEPLRIRADSSHDAPALCFHLLGGVPSASGSPVPGAVPQAQDEHRLAVFLLPFTQAPSPEQVAALAGALGLVSYDARRLLAGTLPRVLACGPARTVRPLAARLAEAGLPLGCEDADSLVDVLSPWLVEWLDVDEDGLYMVGSEGRVPLRVDGEALLVQGRYAWLPQVRPGSGRFSSSSAARPRPNTTRFAHLYLGAEARPFSFVESELRDYAFLGEDMQPSASANFEALIAIMASAPGVRLDTSLQRQEALALTGAAARFWAAVGPTECDSLDPNAELLSRLIHLSTL